MYSLIGMAALIPLIRRQKKNNKKNRVVHSSGREKGWNLPVYSAACPINAYLQLLLRLTLHFASSRYGMLWREALQEGRTWLQAYEEHKI